MHTFYLVSKSINSGENIHLKNTKLSEIDKFIYGNFNTKMELAKHYNVDNTNFYITFKYQNEPKILDLILKDDNLDYHFLLKSVKGYKIDVNNVSFRNIVNKLIYKISDEEIEYLYQNKYIAKNTYINVLKIKHNNKNKNTMDYARDAADLYAYIKKNLNDYIDFRRLYSGLKKYENDKMELVPNIKKINTPSEFVDDSNAELLDELFSCYDLDDLYKLDDLDNLQIDGMGRKK